MPGIRDIQNDWRNVLELASYRGITFHVEVSGRMSGRRTVVHEYPKRNLPYSEDMGRHAVRWSFTGYLILHDKFIGNIVEQRNRLIEALERDDAGLLVHPTLSSSYGGGTDGASAGGAMMVMCERYTITESREKGGYYEIDMQFVEAGEAPVGYTNDTKARMLDAAGAAEDASKGMLDTAVSTTPVGVGAGGV